jgi:hypothetical protein
MQTYKFRRKKEMSVNFSCVRKVGVEFGNAGQLKA